MILTPAQLLYNLTGAMNALAYECSRNTAVTMITADISEEEIEDAIDGEEEPRPKKKKRR